MYDPLANQEDGKLGPYKVQIDPNTKKPIITPTQTVTTHYALCMGLRVHCKNTRTLRAHIFKNNTLLK